MSIIAWSFKIHRWTGIFAGLMAFAWFASGLFMHWYSFADPSETESLRATSTSLVAAQLPEGLRPPTTTPAGEPVAEARLKQVAGQLIWEVHAEGGGKQAIDARTGAPWQELTPAQAVQVAAPVVHADPAAARVERVTEYDEFYYSRGFPLPAYRVSFGEPYEKDVYLDPATGEVAAVIGTAERVSRVFGGMPHFLNIGIFHTERLAWLILMSALVTAVLVSAISGTIYGSWLLSRQWQSRKKKKKKRARGERSRSVKQGVRTVHHWVGITTGIFVITYTLSGYLMLWYPGVEPAPAEVERLTALPTAPGSFALSVPEALRVVERSGAGPVRTVNAHGLLDRPVYEAKHPDGTSTLLDARTAEVLSPLPDSAVRAVVAGFLGTDPQIRSVTYLERHDPYYYSLHERARPLPVYRVDLERSSSLPSPIYIDADGGQVVGRVDGSYRAFRWLGSAVHTFDFPAIFFRPTLWDILVVLAALTGVVITATGTWLGSLHLLRAARRRRTTLGGPATAGP